MFVLHTEHYFFACAFFAPFPVTPTLPPTLELVVVEVVFLVVLQVTLDAHVKVKHLQHPVNLLLYFCGLFLPGGVAIERGAVHRQQV